MTKNLWSNITVAMLLVIPPSFVMAQQSANRPTCAILTFDARTGVSTPEAEMLSDRFATEFDRLGQYTIVTRSRMREVLEEQEFQATDSCSAAACAVEAGQLLGVRYMVYGTIGRLGQLYSINSFMIDVETGAQIRSATSDLRGGIEEALTVLMAANAHGLLKEEPPKRLDAHEPAFDEPDRPDPTEEVPIEEEPDTFAWRRFWIGAHVSRIVAGDVSDYFDTGIGAHASFLFSPNFAVEAAFTRFPCNDDMLDMALLSGSLAYLVNWHPNLQTPLFAGITYMLSDTYKDRLNYTKFDLELKDAFGAHVGAGLHWLLWNRFELFTHAQYLFLDSEVALSDYGRFMGVDLNSFQISIGVSMGF